MSKPKELIRPSSLRSGFLRQSNHIRHPLTKPLLLPLLPWRFVLPAAVLPLYLVLGCDGKALKRVLPRLRPLNDLPAGSHHIAVKSCFRNKKLSVKNIPRGAELFFKVSGILLSFKCPRHLAHDLVASHRKNRHITAHTVKPRNLADAVASWQSLLADRLDPPHPFLAEIIHFFQKGSLSLEAVYLPDTIRKLRCLRGHALVKYHAVIRHLMDNSPVSVHLKGGSPQKPQCLLTDFHLSLHEKSGKNIVRVVSKPPGELRIAGHNSLSHTGNIALNPVVNILVPVVHMFKDRLPGKGQRRSPSKLPVSFLLLLQKLFPVFPQRPCLFPGLFLRTLRASKEKGDPSALSCRQSQGKGSFAAACILIPILLNTAVFICRIACLPHAVRPVVSKQLKGFHGLVADHCRRPGIFRILPGDKPTFPVTSDSIPSVFSSHPLREPHRHQIRLDHQGKTLLNRSLRQITHRKLQRHCSPCVGRPLEAFQLYLLSLIDKPAPKGLHHKAVRLSNPVILKPKPEAIKQLDGRKPDAPHLMRHMLAPLRKASVLRSYHVEPVSRH